MSNNTIFYFSGTGNSLQAAKLIAEKIGDCDIKNIAKINNNGSYILEGKPQRIGFVFPCYAMGLPNIVKQFIKSLEIPGIRTESYCFAVVTCGGSGGNSLSIVKELLSSKRLELSYGAVQKMFSNYLPLYKMADNAKEMAEKSNAEIKKIASEILSETWNDIPKAKGILSILNGIASKSLHKNVKFYSVSDACKGCGNCSKICPVGNITMQNGKPSFGVHCEQCVACIQWCSQQAINFKNKTQDSLRYHHPEITFAEMLS
ncbi:flavodoxin [Spirochaetia bacterium]|nr:flavodoxin [Spirochaetia bacterium]